MGYPKADLPFGDQTLLSRVVEIVSTECSSVVVVAAAGQRLPKLPPHVIVAHDRRDARGPLEGIAAGMSALATGVENPVDAVYVTSCDVPELRGEFIRYMVEQLGSDDDAAVPRCERFHHPLAAVYRMGVLPVIQRLLANELLQAAYLFDHVRTHEVALDAIRDSDPDLRSLENLNTPELYLAALERCGLQPEPGIVSQLRSAIRTFREK